MKCVWWMVASGMLVWAGLFIAPKATAEDAGQVALQRLQVGNDRFASGTPRHPHEASDWRQEVESQQRPFAVIVGCSDSRVPPELIFDQGFGDLFIVRVAGHVVDTDVVASVEYAVYQLQAPLVVVMGHTQCGAVRAAAEKLADPSGEPAEVISLLTALEPALLDAPTDIDLDGVVRFGVRRNVELSTRRLSRVPDLRERIESGRMLLIGAVYDMHTGRVEFVEPSTETVRSFVPPLTEVTEDNEDRPIPLDPEG